MPPSKEKPEKPDSEGSGAPGNAATRLEAFVYSQGAQSWLKDPDMDSGCAAVRERDRKKREALLHKIQQKLYDEACFIPIWELGFLCASGPRAAVSGLGLIPGISTLDPMKMSS